MKKSIRIMGAVRKPDCGAEGHNWFLVLMTRHDFENAQHKASVCKAEGFSSVSTYTHDLSVYIKPPLEASEIDMFVSDGHDTELPDGETDIEDAGDEEPCIAGLELVVTDSELWWTWFVGDSDIVCETEQITFKELEETFKS